MRDTSMLADVVGANSTAAITFGDTKAATETVRVVRLQARLANKVAELQATIDTARQLRGLLPICSYCKRVRNDQNYWERVEVYVTQHSDAKFTHGICPTCLDAVHAEIVAEESSIRKAKEPT